MGWGAVLKGVGKAAAGGAKKIAKDKLLNRKKNVKNRRAKAQEAMGGGGGEQERGGPLAIRPTTSLVPYSAGALAKVDDGGGGDGGDGATPKELVLSINKKIIRVERLLKGSVSIRENAREDARKAKEVASDKAQEKALEKEKPKDGYMKIPGAKAAQSLLGKMFNFIGTILLGWVLVRWEKWLPKLLKVAKWLAIGADWILDKAGKILNVLAGVIDAGYKFIDKLKGWVSNIYGEEGLKKFTTFLGNLKDLVTGFMLWKMFGEKIFKAMVEGIKLLWKAVTQGIRKAWVVVRRMIGRHARIFLKNIASKVASGARAVGRGILNVGKSAVSRVGGVLSRGGSTLAKTGAGKVVAKVGGFATKIFGKAAKFIAPALKGAMPAIKGFAKRIPIFGSLIVAIVSLMSGEPLGQALFKGVGAALGGALGTFIPIPFLGTLLGETIGAFVGDLLYYGIVEKDWKKAGAIFKQHIMAIFSFLTKIPILGDLIQKLAEGGNMIWNFAKWIFFDAPGWVFKQLGGGAKILKEFFDQGMKRFMDNFPVFNLPLMKFRIPFTPVKVDINWILGKAFGGIPWFKQWINDEDQLMHFPDFSMFIPLVGLPFLVGHVGKSLFPGSFFEKWPSGASSIVNPLAEGLGIKIKEAKEKVDDQKDSALKAVGLKSENSKVSDEGLKTYASYETMGPDTVKIASASKPAEESEGGSGTVKFVPVPTGGGSSDSYEVLDAFG